MFCTKCGKELHDGDIFCAYCGNKVRAAAAPESNTSRYAEVVFNPPFKIEAQRRTEEISQEVKQYSQEPRRESLQFDWNLDGFPGSKPKKEEDFKFNWDDVLERKRDSREIDVEKILFASENEKKKAEQEIKAEEVKEEVKIEIPKAKESEAKEEMITEDLFADKTKSSKPLSIEELERELFGEAPSVEKSEEEDLALTRRYEKDMAEPKDKFYTYNAKRDAFQELLDKERQRIQQMEDERKAQWENLTPTQEQIAKTPNEALSFEDVFQEPKIFKGDMLKEVAVVLPPLTAVVMADEDDEAKAEALVENSEIEETVVEEPAEEIETKAEEVPPFQEESLKDKDKTKLRYSDVFPVEDIDADNGGCDDSDDSGKEKQVKPLIEEDDEDEVKKTNPVLKVLIIILAIMVVAEIIIIGAKVIAPESAFSMKVDSLVESIAGVFGGGEEDPDAGIDIDTDEMVLAGYISDIAGNIANIGTVEEDTDLKYDMTKAYAFDGIAQSQEFEDGTWIEAADGTKVAYGQGIIEGLITYYDHLGENQLLAEGIVGVNKLEIGEVRAGETGYYVLCKVTYAGDGGDVVKYETAYLEAGSQIISVKEVKEETL